MTLSVYEQQKAAKERMRAQKAKDVETRNALIRLLNYQAKMKIIARGK